MAPHKAREEVFDIRRAAFFISCFLLFFFTLLLGSGLGLRLWIVIPKG